MTLSLNSAMNSLSISTLHTSVTPLNRRTTSRFKLLSSSSSIHISSSQQNQFKLKALNNNELGFNTNHSINPLFRYPTSNAYAQGPATGMRGAESDPMGLLLKERIVFLGNEIDDFVADSIVSQLLLLDAQDPTKDIRLFINSPGGSLTATMAIMDIVQLVRADVSTIALGIAASTASIILGVGTKGKRLAMPNTRIMIHQPLGGASGEVLNVEIQANEIASNKKNVTRIISEFTGRTYEQVEKDIDRDRYMSPTEAVEYGLLDGVIDRNYIIPLVPVPDKVKGREDYMQFIKDPIKFVTPDIPDDEVY